MSHFFNNLRCDFCKGPAHIFRNIGGRTHIICDSKACDLKSRIKENYFKSNFNFGGQNNVKQ